MKYYHGSRAKNLKKLSLDKSNDGYVWLTEQYEFALLYAGSTIRFWNYNFDTNKLIIREVGEDCFKKLYKGVTCYIYSATDVGEFENSSHLGRRSIRCKHDVDLTLYEVIPDAYDKIMELYEKGIIELHFWKDYSNEEKENIINSTIKSFAPNIEIEYEKFRDEYELLTSIRPELKLENLKRTEK